MSIQSFLFYFLLFLPLLHSHPPPLQPYPLLRLQSTGLAGETCIKTTDCQGTKCVYNRRFECDGDHLNCVCDTSPCNSTTKCFPGEICDGTSNKVCLSTNARGNQREGNLTLGSCRNQQHCATGRDCFSIDAFAQNVVQLCAPNVTTCACFPLNMKTCTTVNSTEECEDGEICQEYSKTAKACLDPDFVPLPDSQTDDQMEDLVQEQSNGLTFDECKENLDCISGRKCLVPIEKQLKQCGLDNEKCICIPSEIRACENAQDCEIQGETCVILQDVSVCASEMVEEEIEDDNASAMISLIEGTVEIREPEFSSAENVENQDADGKVCIAMKELEHLDKDDLVFEQGRHAHVLCDVFGSCATAGHIVEFDGVVMMMMSYCDVVEEGCKRWRMKVNSPRLRRKRRITSRSPGLKYTALAARYETSTEERLLRLAVRLGL